ncbi:unnamed protein product [Mytilus coruscus]|uniref:CHRNN n=1 Tax=Mytilus coruscus TaxID=42192 RepID=A0A6J8AAP5_MYTCO|nr:unnamed protein product [Mytilus coruscus]
MHLENTPPLPQCGSPTELIDSLKYSTSYTASDANTIHDLLFNQSGYNTQVLPDYPVIVKSRIQLDDCQFTCNIFEIKNLGDDKTVRIQYNGEIRWELPAVLSTSCDMDVTFFPYDSQTCDIELASWGFPADAVNLTFFKTNVNLEAYRTDEEWNLVSTSQHPNELIEDDLVFSELSFRIVLERLPGHYIMSVIYPTILTAVLTFVTFFLPLESGDKIGYILTVLLALAVLLTLFSDSMPTTSKHTSVLVVFLTVTLGMACLVIIFTIFIIRLFHQPEHDKAPKWMHSLARKFLKLKCRSERINHRDHLDQSQITENDQPKDGRVCLESRKPFTPYTNKELAEFFDYFLLGVFTVLYILVLLCFPIVLSS